MYTIYQGDRYSLQLYGMIVMEHVLNDHIITFIIVVTVEVLRWEKDQEDTKPRFILLVYEGGIVPSIFYQF